MITVKKSSLISVADKLREGSGNEDLLLFPQGFVDEVDAVAECAEAEGYAAGFAEGQASGGGTATAEEKDVNFYDYDGTLLYSYTLDEIQALTELPTPPTPPKDFLLFDEWNWTLADIKAYNNPLQVGAIYKTIDGKTYAVIQIEEDWQKSVTVRYCQWCSSITVDWGDGTAEAPTTTGSGTNITKTHTYANKGTYIITIDADGTWNMGLNSAANPFFGSSDNNGSAALREVYVGNSARLLGCAFIKALRLEKCTIPKTSTQTWSSTFSWCSSLKAIVLPGTFTKLEASSFNYAMSLSVVSLPKSITDIAYYSFNYTKVKRMTLPPAKSVYLGGNSILEQIIIPEGVETLSEPCNTAYNLKEVTIPSTVTNISASSFARCWSLLRIRFKSATPPTVANANAFTEIPATCIVEVPDLATYQAATNYGTIAAQMVEG